MAKSLTTQLRWKNQSCEIISSDKNIACHFIGPEPITSDAIHLEIEKFLRTHSPSRPFSMSDLIVGDDQVAIAASGEIHLISTPLQLLVDQLNLLNIPDSNITIISHKTLAEGLRGHFGDRFKIITHDPSAESDRAYLASTSNGSRLYLNRNLLDTDIVLPMLVAEPLGIDAGLGYLSGYWPGFGDQQSTEAVTGKYAKDKGAARSEIREAIWLSGLHSIIAVVPARAGIASISLYEPIKMQHELNASINELWRVKIANDVRLALLVAGRCEVSSLNTERFNCFCRNVSKVATQCSKTAIAFELEDDLINEIQRLDSRELKAQGWYKHLARAAGNGTIYALSNLPADLVEELDIIALESPNEISRLLEKNNGWAVIEDADRARIVFESSFKS